MGTQESRVAALTGAVGVGGNVQLISSNITYSTSIDTLTGGPNYDWFWSKTTDKITDLQAGDTWVHP